MRNFSPSTSARSTSFMSAPNRAALPQLAKGIEPDSVPAHRQAGRRGFSSATTWQVAQPYFQWLVVAGVLLALYAPVIQGLLVNWYQDPDYSHGFFVPLLSAYLIWRKRAELLSLPARPSWYGLFIVPAALGLLFLGTLGAELFLTRIALVSTLAGLVIYFLGWPTLRSISFPMGLLLLMIPLPALVYNEIVFPLQFVASAFATKVLETVNLFPVLKEGNILVLPQNRIEVVEACSGIRSLMSLITLAVCYGYFAERNRYLRIALVLLVIPLAVISNGLRVVGTAMLTYYWGPEAAEGFLHSFSGWVIFIVATCLLLVLHKMINVVQRTGSGKLTIPAAQP
jgi:exosortase